MEYEPGVEKHHYTETAADRRAEFWHRFENNHGFAVGPMIFFVGIVVAMLIFKGIPGQ